MKIKAERLIENYPVGSEPYLGRLVASDFDFVMTVGVTTGT